MSHYEPETLLDHIKMVDNQHNSKDELIKKYYPNLESFDFAIPIVWIRYAMQETGESFEFFASSYVWGYRMYNQDLQGIPLPLSTKAAEILIELKYKENNPA